MRSGGTRAPQNQVLHASRALLWPVFGIAKRPREELRQTTNARDFERHFPGTDFEIAERKLPLSDRFWLLPTSPLGPDRKQLRLDETPASGHSLGARLGTTDPCAILALPTRSY